jgi:hypothetical protein
MMKLWLGAAVAALMVLSGRAQAQEKVEYKVYPRYFVKNTVKMPGDEAYWVVTNRKKFDELFGVGFTSGKKPDLVPKDAFDKEGKLAVVAVKQGKTVTTYTVEKVTLKDGTLKVEYKAASKGKGGSATFRSPLIITVPKKDVKAVEFVENGKKVQTVKVGK